MHLQVLITLLESGAAVEPFMHWFTGSWRKIIVPGEKSLFLAATPTDPGGNSSLFLAQTPHCSWRKLPRILAETRRCSSLYYSNEMHPEVQQPHPAAAATRKNAPKKKNTQEIWQAQKAWARTLAAKSDRWKPVVGRNCDVVNALMRSSLNWISAYPSVAAIKLRFAYSMICACQCNVIMNHVCITCVQNAIRTIVSIAHHNKQKAMDKRHFRDIAVHLIW